MATSSPPPSIINLFIVGGTGEGKSSTGNTLTNNSTFVTRRSTESVTGQIKSFQIEASDVLKINVVDSPGLSETKEPVYERLKEIVHDYDSALNSFKEGFDAVVLVLSFNPFTSAKNKTIKRLENILGQAALPEFGVVVITYGDHYKEETEGPFDEWCCKQTGALGAILQKCKHRVVLFDNNSQSTDEKEKMRDNLLTKIKKRPSFGTRYTQSHFKDAQPSRSKMMRELELSSVERETKDQANGFKSRINDIVNSNRRDMKVKDLQNLCKEVILEIQSVKLKDDGTGVFQKPIENLETIERQINRDIENINKEETRREMEELTRAQNTVKQCCVQ